MARRVRIIFENPQAFLRKNQRWMGLDRCWILLHPRLLTIFDIAAHLSEIFRLRRCQPCDLVLSIDGFVLPPFESSAILNENDILRVTKMSALEKEVIKIGNDEHPIQDLCLLEANQTFMRNNDLDIRDLHEKSTSKCEYGAVDLAKSQTKSEEILCGNADAKGKKRRSEIHAVKKKVQKQPSCNDPIIPSQWHETITVQPNENYSQEKSIVDFCHENNGVIMIAEENLSKENNQADVHNQPLPDDTAVSNAYSLHGLVRLDEVDGNCGARASTSRPQVSHGSGQELKMPLLNGNGEDDENNFGEYTILGTKEGDISGREGTVNLMASEDNDNGRIKIESLLPLSRLPQDGDVVAYRLLNLSVPFRPRLSSFRVGKVASYNPLSLSVVLVPSPDFSIEHGTEVGEVVPSTVFPYKEDGSLEIEYPSLVDVRLIKGHDLKMTTHRQGNINKWEANSAYQSSKQVATPHALAATSAGQTEVVGVGGGWDAWPKIDNSAVNAWLNFYRTFKENLFIPVHQNNGVRGRQGPGPSPSPQRGSWTPRAGRGRVGTRGVTIAPRRGLNAINKP